MMNAFQFRDSDTKYNEKLFEFKKTLKIDFGVHEQIAGIPYWTEIFPDIYVYSSFWMNNKSRSLLFTRNTQITTLWKMKCKMHYKNNYDDSQKTNIILLDKQGSGMFLFFECIPFDNKVPHSITFVHENLISSVSSPIISGDSYIGKYTMCMQPLPPAFNNVDKILEFIIYHSQMGVQLFIFYEAGLSLNVRRLLMELTVKDNIHALLLPWNVPFGTQTEFSTQELYFLDCFHRVVAKNYSDFALKLRLSDFVVSKEFQFNLYKYIKAYDSSVDVFQLDEKVFCEEYPSDLIAHNLLCLLLLC
ncbi:glycosyltransferase family 92 protein [Caerostris extrusa]|uniref:Glycosyltransferase family 92 protein n=1 Tax=Caerostris extrusa TaxID=172846 RepID=A0AAV4QAZ3_CAEEX|nr:glycosyltransferase family 92 protein [Caerostris extrusa]